MNKVKIIIWGIGAFLLSVVVGIVFEVVISLLGLPPMPTAKNILTLTVFILAVISLNRSFRKSKEKQ